MAVETVHSTLLNNYKVYVTISVELCLLVKVLSTQK